MHCCISASIKTENYQTNYFSLGQFFGTQIKRKHFNVITDGDSDSNMCVYTSCKQSFQRRITESLKLHFKKLAICAAT